jgi:hypothetical protein
VKSALDWRLIRICADAQKSALLRKKSAQQVAHSSLLSALSIIPEVSIRTFRITGQVE